MAKAPITQKQWDEIENRYFNGESARKLGLAFAIAESGIRKKYSAQLSTIREVAHALVEAETALKALPISAQIRAVSLAEEMKLISGHLTSGAKYGAATFQKLAAIANAKAEKLDKSGNDEEGNAKLLKGITAHTLIANEAARPGLSLLAVNKERIPKEERNNIPSGLSHFYGGDD